MTTQRSLDDIQKDAEKAAQEAKFKVEGDQVEIELDTGKIRIFNCGDYAIVNVSNNDHLSGIALIPLNANAFKIWPLPWKQEPR